MKFFRVGLVPCLADGRRCAARRRRSPSRPPRPPSAAPTAETAADGSTLKVTAPALVSPVDGARAEDRRPTLIWLNSHRQSTAGIGVAYDIEVSTPTATVYTRTVGESPDFGAHLIDLDLDYDTVYSWRVRARVGNRQFGPWSSWASFLSPTRPVATAPHRRRRCQHGWLRRAALADGSRRDAQAEAERLGDRRARSPAQFPAALAQFLPGTRRVVGIHGSHD